MKKILIALILSSAIASAQETGCLFNSERYPVGSIVSQEGKHMLCSKSRSGTYMWVAASDDDINVGCLFDSINYPKGSIMQPVPGSFLECVALDGVFRWANSKSCH